MADEVKIKLTEAQRAKIKSATGKEMSEIRVGRLGKNPAVSASQKTLSARAAARNVAAREGAGIEMARSFSARTAARNLGARETGGVQMARSAAARTAAKSAAARTAARNAAARTSARSGPESQ